MYESMASAGFHGFGNHVSISSWSFLIDTLAACLTKEQIYTLFVLRSMNTTSNQGKEL
jgi:hypothetical protein